MKNKIIKRRVGFCHTDEKKVMKKLLTVIFTLVVCFAFFACDTEPKDPVSPQAEEITVTFTQLGQEDIVKTVAKGETLTDVPVPQSVIGYTVTWDKSDFSSLTQDVTVNAVFTANTYEITYDAGDGGVVTPQTQEVTFDSTPTLAVPVRSGFDFVCWLYNGTPVQGKWTIAQNVTLTASYVEQIQDEYTIIFVQAGQENIEFTVARGQDFSEQMPTPAAKTGYTVEWDKTLEDLTNLTSNIVVNAIETAKSYVISFSAPDASVAVSDINVTYDNSYALPTPVHNDSEHFSFNGWTYNGEPFAINGLKWQIDEDDVTLVATWKEWSGRY